MKIKILDIIVTLIIIGISVVIIVYPPAKNDKHIELLVGNDIIEIPRNDRLYHFTDDFLDVKGKLNNIGRDIVVEVKSGAVAVSSSSCKDKICVNMPVAKECGDIIICLPNQFAVLINCDK